MRFIIMIVALTAFVSIGSAQTELQSKVDEIFNQWDTPESPGCAIAIIQDGAITYKRGYGMANLEYGIPITPSSIFHVASVSKQFTAMSVLMLAEEGKLSLDDDVRKVIPEVPDFGKTVTIRHLIHHISGIRDQWSLLLMAGWRWETDVVTQGDVLDITSRQRSLNFSPGAEYLYSNTGYTLLAVIVERLSGKTLREFTEENLFQPLAMDDTHFHDDHQMIVKNRAYAYAPTENGGLELSIPDFDVVGATSLFTTVEDLARWDRNFVTARVGGRSLMNEMHRRGRLSDGVKIPYACGLSHGKYRGLATVGHGGADAGYRSHFIRFPGEQFSLAVLCNFPSSNPGRLAQRIADIYLADDFTEPPAQYSVVELSPAELEPLAGIYLHTVSDRVQLLSFDKGSLKIGIGRPAVLQPLGEGRFRIAESSTVVNLASFGNGGGMELRFPGFADRFAAYRKVPRATPGAADLEEYTGTFHAEELGVDYRFSVDTGKLVLWNRKLGERELEPTYADGFTFEGYGMSFTRNSRDEVDGFTLSSSHVRKVRFEKNP